MAWQIPIANQDSGLYLNGDDNVIVSSGIILADSQVYAVFFDHSPSAHRIVVNGTVVGSSAIFGQWADTGIGQVVRIDVGASGRVTGLELPAIDVTGASLRLNNSGVVESLAPYYVAVHFKGEAASSAATVNNSGLVNGDYGFLFDGAFGSVSLNNTGIISASEGYAISDSSDGNTTVTNKGMVAGDVMLGSGVDSYDGRLGHVQGTVSGGAGTDTIYGGTEDNVIDGGSEADTMVGGIGADTYYVDNTNDNVIEAAGQGIDSVFASVSWTVGAGQAIEFLRAANPLSASTLNLRGNEFGQTIAGSVGANTLTGGGGNDTLAGGGGNDKFYFAAALDASTNIDTIKDFANTSGNNDSILLAKSIFTALTGASGKVLTADQFTANTSGTATTALKHIIYETDTGKLFYDADGNKAGGVAGVQFAQLGTLADHPSGITAADFYLV